MSTTETMKTIPCTELYRKCTAGEQVDLIDVRTPVEFREIHADIARNIPLDRIDPQAVIAERNGRKDEPLYIICRSGNRAKQVIEKFHKAGFNNVVNVEGGTQKWAEENLPVVRGKKAMSLERQVRIAAGSMVLIGAVLGYFVHPAWIGLSAFVGAGLIFAGVTDTCGMGIMLSKMPWNQVRETPPQKPASQPTSEACESETKESAGCCG